MFNREINAAKVVIGNRRHGQIRVWQIDAFVRLQQASHDDVTDQRFPFGMVALFQRFQLQNTVIE